MKTPRNPLRKVSKKRISEARIYARKKKAFLEKHEHCAKCGYLIGDIARRELHHWASRAGRLYCEESLFMCLCHICHSWVHSNPELARLSGFLAPKGCWNDYKRAMAAKPQVES